MKIMRKSNGYLLVDMLLAIVLMLVILHTAFEMNSRSIHLTVQKEVIHDTELVADIVKKFVHANKSSLLDTNMYPELARGGGVPHSVYAPSPTVLDGMFENFVPKGKTFGNFTNIWGDRYRVIFKRSQNPNATRADLLSVCLVAVTNPQTSRKSRRAGTHEGDFWLSQGVRQLVLHGGARFGFVEDGTIKGTDWTWSEGLANINTQAGDIAYLVTFNLDDSFSETLSRYPTASDTDNTMEADFDIDDHNVLNVQFTEAQSIDLNNIRFDPSLYETSEEAESSCRNNWIFIRDKTGAKRFVNADGDVFRSFTVSGTSYQGSEKIATFGMNGGPKSPRVSIGHAQPVSKLDNIGRIYYIIPKRAQIPYSSQYHYDNTRSNPNEIFAEKGQIAVCRMVAGTKSLAYIGDNRSEDKIAFVVSAVDGDFIPPFFCPGQDADVAGGGTNSLRNSYSATHLQGTGVFGTATESETLFSSGQNTSSASSGIRPRLFVMPQILMTGSVAFPIQGIRVWAETVNPNDINRGWIVRINTLVDTQRGTTDARSYWVGNNPVRPSFQAQDAPTSSSPGYMTEKNLDFSTTGTSKSDATYVNYLRAVVIGVCSGKLATF